MLLVLTKDVMFFTYLVESVVHVMYSRMLCQVLYIISNELDSADILYGVLGCFFPFIL